MFSYNTLIREPLGGDVQITPSYTHASVYNRVIARTSNRVNKIAIDRWLSPATFQMRLDRTLYGSTSHVAYDSG